MSVSLRDAIDGAHLVKYHPDYNAFGVWHGGHTVNFYTVAGGGSEVDATTTVSIGNYETGETTRQEAIEAIEREF